MCMYVYKGKGANPQESLRHAELSQIKITVLRAKWLTVQSGREVETFRTHLPWLHITKDGYPDINRGRKPYRPVPDLSLFFVNHFRFTPAYMSTVACSQTTAAKVQ
jgi:hypothetical protein